MERKIVAQELLLVKDALYMVSLVQGHPKDIGQIIGRLVYESKTALLIRTWEGMVEEGDEPAEYLIYKTAVRYIEGLKEDEEA